MSTTTDTPLDLDRSHEAAAHLRFLARTLPEFAEEHEQQAEIERSRIEACSR